MDLEHVIVVFKELTGVASIVGYKIASGSIA